MSLSLSFTPSYLRHMHSAHFHLRQSWEYFLYLSQDNNFLVLSSLVFQSKPLACGVLSYRFIIWRQKVVTEYLTIRVINLVSSNKHASFTAQDIPGGGVFLRLTANCRQ